MNDILNFVRQPKVLMGIAIVFALLILTMIFRSLKKNKLRKRTEEHEILYNTCISIPVSFKLNKATNIAKLNPDLETELEQTKKVYVDLEKRHEEISLILEEIEDAISFGKLKLAGQLVDDLEFLVLDTESITIALDKTLDEMLEEEMTQRKEINELKELFRSDRTQLVNNMNLYGQSYELLEVKYKSIEDKFSVFEEWMFANDYEKARSISEEIAHDIERFSYKLETIPKLYVLAKGELPELLDELSSSYQNARNQQVYLEHINVPKSIIYVSDKVKENLKNIAALKLDEAKSSLTNSKEALVSMIGAIENEVSAHFELKDKMRSSFSILEEYSEDVKEALLNKEKVEKRFDFENYGMRIDEYRALTQKLIQKKETIQSLFDENKTPATKQIHVMNEMIEELDSLTKSFYKLNDEVKQANADEIRAQDQLRKLYLIINDVEVRIKKRSLPSISEKYVHDLERSRAYVHQINALLNEDILDISTLNGTVSEAIDYIYQLHNNVNNLVGVVDMCENSIVYANKFRAYVPSIESELTKAELAFNNGEYTQSLTMIIEAIEKFKPNSSYEEMIRNNAKSAY